MRLPHARVHVHVFHNNVQIVSLESQSYSIHCKEKTEIDISSSFQFQWAQISTCLPYANFKVLVPLHELENDFLAKYQIKKK